MENYIDVLNKIENEGLGYFILDYTSSFDMPDEKGAKLFDEAEFALRQFQEYVEEQAKLEESK